MALSLSFFFEIIFADYGDNLYVRELGEMLRHPTRDSNRNKYNFSALGCFEGIGAKSKEKNEILASQYEAGRWRFAGLSYRFELP